MHPRYGTGAGAQSALDWQALGRGERRRDERGTWVAQAGHAGHAAWAQARRLCAHKRAAGPTAYALGARNLFFDSVLFLSHHLDTVREHCSSPNFSNFFLNIFFKSNKIKSNKMGQNFEKNEIFKKKIFVDKYDLIY